MASLKLREYLWTGSSFVDQGVTYNWQPLPKSITKEVEVQKRIVHRGRRKLKKYKYRVRETMTFTLSGSCPSEAKAQPGDLTRRKIEWLSKRNSKFKIIIDADTIEIFKTPSPSNYNDDENLFVVFKDVRFTLTEGKIGWYDYNITLERVNCEGISGFSDPWTCT